MILEVRRAQNVNAGIGMLQIYHFNCRNIRGHEQIRDNVMSM